MCIRDRSSPVQINDFFAVMSSQRLHSHLPTSFIQISSVLSKFSHKKYLTLVGCRPHWMVSPGAVRPPCPLVTPLIISRFDFVILDNVLSVKFNRIVRSPAEVRSRNRQHFRGPPGGVRNFLSQLKAQRQIEPCHSCMSDAP